MNHALSIRGVAKRYSGAADPALRNFDLELAAGEIHALVGGSGCGKTTLLRMVAGLEIPDAGEIRIGGRLVAGAGTWVPPERRGVGMVFQDLALFPHLTVADNVGFGLDGLNRRERRHRVESLLELAGLGKLGGRFPHQLSGGQQQRVALLRALGPGPGLLLLDEPFSNLDTPLRASLRVEVEQIIRNAGVPALVVLHDADDVFALADRATVLRGGVTIQAGTPGELYLHPVDDYVARILGETNVLPAQSAADGCLITPLGEVRCAHPVGAGAGLSVAVRPEDLRVSREAGDGSSATVVRVQLHRAGQRVLVKLDGEPCTLRCDLTADGRCPVGLQPGERVYVGARIDRLRVLAPEPQTGAEPITPGRGAGPATSDGLT